MPSILGMTFLSQVNPTIDWKMPRMNVKRGNRTLNIPCSVFARSNSSCGKVLRFADVASADVAENVKLGHNVGEGCRLLQNSFGELLTTLPPEDFSENCDFEHKNVSGVAPPRAADVGSTYAHTSVSPVVVGMGGLDSTFVVAA